MDKLIGKYFLFVKQSQNKIVSLKSGISLLEVLIYSGIFTVTFLMIMVFVFNTLESSKQINKDITFVQEGMFLIGKINWAFSEANFISFPVLGEQGETLVLVGDSNYIFLLSDGYLTLNNFRLNASNVTVTDFFASRDLDQWGNEKVDVSFKLGTNNFSTTLYVKK